MTCVLRISTLCLFPRFPFDVRVRHFRRGILYCLPRSRRILSKTSDDLQRIWLTGNLEAVA